MAAVGALIVGLGVVALQMGGSSDPEGQVTVAQPPVSSPIDISTAATNPVEPVTFTNVTTEAAATGAEELSHSEQMIAKMTAGTIATLRGQGNSAAAVPTTEQSAAEAAAASALYSMVVTAVSQGQSEAYIDQLVNDAYAKGEIAVPLGLVGASGRVDTKAILSLFIAQ